MHRHVYHTRQQNGEELRFIGYLRQLDIYSGHPRRWSYYYGCKFEPSVFYPEKQKDSICFQVFAIGFARR